METTFLNILKEFKIEIPIIQRDYAQGRKSEEKIAKKLIEDIYNALSNKASLSLDFIYGKTENGKLIPLDGQQRLTTLWLLHWYIALIENKLSDDDDDNIKNKLKKFSYEVRLTSKDFCSKLIENGITYNKEIQKISDKIKNQNWFYLSWEYDPTVVNMLNMLDIIHDIFKNTSGKYYDLLTGDECPIKFYFLQMENFSLTDELYIKMNARGKPLTPFENFKARFSELLGNDNKHKLDTDWLDIFWKEKEEGNENTPDKAEKKFYNFFSNITLLFYVEKNDIDKYFIDTYDLQNVFDEDLKDKNKTVFSDDNINRIIRLLGIIQNYKDDNHAWEYYKKILKPHNEINYSERVRFYSLLMLIDNEVTDNDIIEKWLRVTKNLINNTRIEEPADFSKAIKSLKKLSEGISDIHNYLQKDDVNIEFFYKAQVDEEKIKAELNSSNDKDWEKLIINAEQIPYFDGQIGFLLEMSKTNEKEYDKNKFKQYSEVMQLIFQCFNDKNDEFLFERALLAKGDYLVQKGSNSSFCNFDDHLRAKMDNWRKVFNNSDKRNFLKSLLDQVCHSLNGDYQNEEKIKNAFIKIIEAYDNTDWRYLFIKNKDLLSFCVNKQIRYYDNYEIYLLRKERMSGEHTELYTYDLYLHLINEIENKDILDYKYGYLTDDECYISYNKDEIQLKFNTTQKKFEINYQNGETKLLNIDIYNKYELVNEIKQIFN